MPPAKILPRATELALKVREPIFALIGAMLLSASAGWISNHAPPTATFFLEENGCHTPITIFEASDGRPALADAFVIHGLAANRLIMQRISSELAANHFRVYVPDLPGHGRNSDPFSFARAEECAAAAILSLARGGRLHPDSTALIGHSMGAAIAVRLAERFPSMATVAISPAPMVLPRRMPSNLLVFVAQFDLPMIKREAQAIAQAAGIARHNRTDFLQRRAFELEYIARATHVGLLYSPYVLQQTALWLNRALRNDIALPHSHAPDLQPAAALGFVGLFLCFPFVVSLTCRIFRAEGAESATATPFFRNAILHGALAALFGVGVLKFFIPLQFVRVLTGGYLASLLLISGLVFLALRWKEAQAQLLCNARAFLSAIALGVISMLVAGAWLSWQMTEAWVTPSRLWRFAVILPAAWIYCFAEEIAIGPPGQRSGRRFASFLLLRLFLWLACMLALFFLASGQILILLLVVYLAAFSILERLGTDAVRRRTGSAAAASIFSAILAAWFIATVLPLT